MQGGGWGAGGRPLTWGRAPRPAPAAPRAELQVQETNYSTFALVLFQGRPGGWPDIRVNLLCEPRVPAPAPPPGAREGQPGRCSWPRRAGRRGGAPGRGGGALGGALGRGRAGLLAEQGARWARTPGAQARPQC